MGLLNDMTNRVLEFARSDTAKKMMEKMEDAKAKMAESTSGLNGLRYKVERLERNRAGFCCEGVLKNVGTSTYEKIVLSVEFKDQNGNIVDKKNVNALEFGVLFDPGESRPFRVYSDSKTAQKVHFSISEFIEC